MRNEVMRQVKFSEMFRLCVPKPLLIVRQTWVLLPLTYPVSEVTNFHFMEIFNMSA